MISKKKRLPAFLFVSLAVAGVVSVTAAGVDFHAILTGKSMALGKLQLGIFVLFSIALVRRLQPGTAWVASAMAWILLNLPVETNTTGASRHNLALSLAFIWVVLFIFRNPRVLWRRLETIWESAVFKIAFAFFWCFVVSACLLRLVGGYPVLLALIDPKASPFTEPVILVGSYVFLLTVLVLTANWKINTPLLIHGVLFILGVVAVTQFLITNHPTYSFYRDLNPLTTFANPPIAFCFVIFFLFALTLIVPDKKASPMLSIEANLTVASRWIALLMIVLSFNYYLYLSTLLLLVVYFEQYKRLTKIGLLRSGISVVFCLSALGILWHGFALNFLRVLDQQWQDLDVFQFVTFQTQLPWKAFFESPLLGIGPLYKEVLYQNIRTLPQTIKMGDVLQILSFGGLLLLVPVASVIAAFYSRCSRALMSFSLATLPFIYTNQLFSEAVFLLLIVSFTAAAGLTPNPTNPLPRPSRRWPRWVTRPSVWIPALLVVLLPLHFVTSTYVLYRFKAPSAAEFSKPIAVPETFIYGLLLTEDNKFFDHRGFDWKGISRSLQKNLEKNDFFQGASTIPMQLAKLLYLSKEKTVARKARQALLTVFIEHDLTKPDILRRYIGLLDFGLQEPGLAFAADRYFHKTPPQLTIEECLKLVLTLPNPKMYNPGMPDNPDILRKLAVLNKRLWQEWFLFRTEVQNLTWVKREPYY